MRPLLIPFLWLVRFPVWILLALAISANLEACASFSWHEFLPVFLLGALLYGGAFAMNDAADTEVDRVNLPSRPIASGKLSRRTALRIGIAMKIFAFCVAVTIGTKAVLYVASFTILSIAYSYEVKTKHLYLKNPLAALLGSSIFLFLASRFSPARVGLFFFIASFFLNSARELIMDMRDISGDCRVGIPTIPTTHGLRLTLILAAIYGSIGLMWLFAPAAGLWGLVVLPWRVMGAITVLFLGGLAAASITHYSEDPRKFFWFTAESIKVYWLLLLLTLTEWPVR